MSFVFASKGSNEMLHVDVGIYEELSDRDRTRIKHITLSGRTKNLNKKEESSTN